MNLYRLSGAGNDFLALPLEPGSETPGASDIERWCRRGVSLGADGLFTLERTDHGARMVHHNADGGRSTLCLNGSRCAVRLAYHLGWHQDGRLTLTTDAGDLAARVVDDTTVAVALPAIHRRPRGLALQLPDHFDAPLAGWFVDVGVPHLVLPWHEPLHRLDIARLGPPLRHHGALGDDGANVDFVRFDGPHRFEMRTWERGVEGETLACGTGVVATVAAGVASGKLQPPVTALTAGGFELRLEGRVEGPLLHDVVLQGDARIVATVQTTPEALALPER